MRSLSAKRVKVNMLFLRVHLLCMMLGSRPGFDSASTIPTPIPTPADLFDSDSNSGCIGSIPTPIPTPADFCDSDYDSDSSTTFDSDSDSCTTFDLIL